MRVAYVIPYLQTESGWRSLAVGAISALSRYVEPTLVVSYADMPIAKELFPEVDLFPVPQTQAMTLKAPRQWGDFLATCYVVARRSPPDVELVHALDAYPSGLVAQQLARRRGVPYIITAVGTYAVRWHASSLDRAVYSGVLRRAAYICPISTGTASLMQRYFGIAMLGKSLRVILLGTDYPRQIPREEVQKNTPGASPTLLSVGAIKPRKGYHVSLRAFELVKQKVPEARYRIVGKIDRASYFYQLQQYIKDHHLQDIEFLGHVNSDELKACYKTSNLFLLTPQQDGFDFEGFGLAFIEAGAYGLPVVGTHSGGVPDAVIDGVTGYLIEDDNIQGIAAAACRLLGDPALARTMGLANRDWSERLSWERYADEQSAVYREVLSKSYE